MAGRDKITRSREALRKSRLRVRGQRALLAAMLLWMRWDRASSKKATWQRRVCSLFLGPDEHVFFAHLDFVERYFDLRIAAHFTGREIEGPSVQRTDRRA